MGGYCLTGNKILAGHIVVKVIPTSTRIDCCSVLSWLKLLIDQNC